MMEVVWIQALCVAFITGALTMLVGWLIILRWQDKREDEDRRKLHDQQSGRRRS
jgi:hypothetical protein